ncbi:hypothetical protein [Geodermatophilus sp. DSM 45219]|uniref:hypothetical protein n=1 Tax=Geodermatophilus sp. DSM 45219 TaxID=1881103 RepID=UPI00088F3A16|nr:hypothetical protein [Geodermatophilus sp. DSM 45219]SDO46301.1 hypothetical protein SAMN05428965_4046 [Geodermatophilus sp. DSM 45219]
MPRVRRTAAALAVVLAIAACTGGDGDGPTRDDAPDRAPELLGTVDLDAAVDGDARLLDLAPAPDGHPVALLTDGGTRGFLVEVEPGDDGPVATVLLEVPAVGDDAELGVLPDGSFLVAGTSPTAGYQLLTVPPDGQATVVGLGVRPDSVATALSPDGRTFYAALTLADGPAQLIAVDLGEGVVRTTAPVVPPGTVTALTPRPDGGLAALVETAEARALLAGFDPGLRPVGEPVDLAPEDPVGHPADLDVAADGTVVATLHVSEGRESGLLVTVVDGAVARSVALDGVGDSALDVLVSPDGASAWVPQADLSYPAELVTVDLATGERLSVVSLCDGAGVLGDVAPVGADGGILATGSCIDGDGPQATAFLVG